MQTEYAEVLEEKKKAYAEYRRSREEMRELLTAKANVDRLLNMEAEHDAEKEKRPCPALSQGTVQSVQRTRSRRMKFCVQGGLGGNPQQAAPEAEWLSRGHCLPLFFAEMKRAREETVKFHSLAQFASIFLDSSVNSCMVSCVWCSRVSRISDGQLE